MKNKFKARICESEEKGLEGRKISCNIINEDNMTKPPKWFQHWSETVYQKQPPQWFNDWSKYCFEPLVTKVDTIIKLNNLRTQ